ncbi:MAG: hypothetical protein U0704_13670 [Candidatus Eisenbacteria bacterium]
MHRTGLHTALLVCALLSFAGTAHAARSLSDTTSAGMAVAPRHFSVELMTTGALPLPYATANRSVSGLDVGLSATVLENASAGMGFDYAYHYWPVNDAFKRAVSTDLRNSTLTAVEFGPGTWGLQVVQMTGHLAIESPALAGRTVWLRVGGGVYRVDPNTTGYSGDAGFFIVNMPPLKRTFHRGAYVMAGGDVFGVGPMRVGLDALYHHAWTRNSWLADLDVWSVGAHARFRVR